MSALLPPSKGKFPPPAFPLPLSDPEGLPPPNPVIGILSCLLFNQLGESSSTRTKLIITPQTRSREQGLDSSFPLCSLQGVTCEPPHASDDQRFHNTSHHRPAADGTFGDKPYSNHTTDDPNIRRVGDSVHQLLPVNKHPQNFGCIQQWVFILSLAGVTDCSRLGNSPSRGLVAGFGGDGGCPSCAHLHSH